MKFILMMTVTLMISSIFAQENSPILLTDINGNQIQINAKFETPTREGCYKCPITTHANPLKIKVFTKDRTAIESINVVLLNFKQAGSGANTTGDIHMDEYKIKLSYDELSAAYSGEIGQLNTFVRGYNGTWKYRQEIAVVIKTAGHNEFWLFDPISRSNNFKFKLYK